MNVLTYFSFLMRLRARASATAIIVFVFVFAGVVDGQEPVRKGLMGLVFKPGGEALTVDSVLAQSTGAALGLKKGDVLISVNAVETKTLPGYQKVIGTIRTGDPVVVDLKRGETVLHLAGKSVMKPLETSDVFDIQYDWVRFREGYLRTITRRPKGQTNLPAILLIPGYGCGSIEGYTGSYNGRIMTDWLRAGYAVVTIEKSGLGDSYHCPPCTEVDLVTDIESFDAGYVFMENLPFVDKSRLFIWGHSMGGVIAPEIAKHHHPKGVMVYGTVFRPWSEFLLEMHRIQEPLINHKSYPETEAFVREMQKIYYEFFVLKKSPAMLYQNPEYRSLVVSELDYKEGSTNQWGRHWRFWQQLDSLNLADSWRVLACPVLVLHGASDYIQCSSVEPVLIENAVNSEHAGHATRVTMPGIDHMMMRSKDYPEALEHFNAQEWNKGNYNPVIGVETVGWLRRVDLD
jgi:hypothetical protein